MEKTQDTYLSRISPPSDTKQVAARGKKSPFVIVRLFCAILCTASKKHTSLPLETTFDLLGLLPEVRRVHIFKYLPVKDLVTLSRTSKELNEDVKRSTVPSHRLLVARAKHHFKRNVGCIRMCFQASKLEALLGDPISAKMTYTEAFNILDTSLSLGFVPSDFAKRARLLAENKQTDRAKIVLKEAIKAANAYPLSRKEVDLLLEIAKANAALNDVEGKMSTLKQAQAIAIEFQNRELFLSICKTQMALNDTLLAQETLVMIKNVKFRSRTLKIKDLKEECRIVIYLVKTGNLEEANKHLELVAKRIQRFIKEGHLHFENAAVLLYLAKAQMATDHPNQARCSLKHSKGFIRRIDEIFEHVTHLIKMAKLYAVLGSRNEAKKALGRAKKKCFELRDPTFDLLKICQIEIGLREFESAKETAGLIPDVGEKLFAELSLAAAISKLSLTIG